MSLTQTKMFMYYSAIKTVLTDLERRMSLLSSDVKKYNENKFRQIKHDV